MEPTNVPEQTTAEAQSYEITATEHVNKHLLECFKKHLDNKTVDVPANDLMEESSWSDDEKGMQTYGGVE